MEQSQFLDIQAQAYRDAFLEDYTRFADLIDSVSLKKEYHIVDGEKWIPNYIIDLQNLTGKNLRAEQSFYEHTAKIFRVGENYYCEKLIRNRDTLAVSVKEHWVLLQKLYEKGIGVLLRNRSIYIWNDCVKYSVLYPYYVASKKEIFRYYFNRLSKLYGLDAQQLREVLKCEEF